MGACFKSFKAHVQAFAGLRVSRREATEVSPAHHSFEHLHLHPWSPAHHSFEHLHLHPPDMQALSIMIHGRLAK